MDSVVTKKSHTQPMTMAELLPGLRGILSKDTMQTLTAQKKPRSTLALTRTSEKNVKPLTIAEMRADILALRAPSPKRFAQPSTSTKKKMWNASVKLDNKSKSQTADGQLKNNPVRKVLNFQPKPKVIQNPRVIKTETPKFIKPEIRINKTLHLQANSTVRLSGVYKIPETPVLTNKSMKFQMTRDNKENSAPKTNVIRKDPVTPIIKKKQVLTIPDTPLANILWKLENDASFLEHEKDVQYIEDKTKALAEEPTLENISEVSPIVSTPFKEYRNVQEYFNHSNDVENSTLCNDNTIMCFDKLSHCKGNNIQDESVVASLCDLFNKASVANVDEPKTELNDLLEVEKQLEHNIKMVENGIKMLTNIKDSHIKSLQHVKRVIKEKNVQNNVKNENNNSLIKVESDAKLKESEKLIEISPVSSKPCRVLNTKSPTYTIPKKTPCLRKKILHKSMPNVSRGLLTPKNNMDKRAFNMYMGMKLNELNFLNTPCTKQRKSEVPDTPAITSHNLQMQLNKIYEDDT